jgi:DNA (cytosine-5)-methyltransferase 1
MSQAQSPNFILNSELNPTYFFRNKKVGFSPTLDPTESILMFGRTGDLKDPFQNWWRGMLDQNQRPREISGQSGSVTYIDLFSSVGGLSLGFGLAAQAMGILATSLFAVDTDENALHVYKHNFSPRYVSNSSVLNLVDYKVSGQGLNARFDFPPSILDGRLKNLVGEVDVVLAGPPCQGHSTLNNHSRGDDPRNLLYLAVPAVAIALKAEAIIIENVPNVVNDKNGVVESTKSLLLSAGYILSYAILAADELGWAQTRKRYFMVARKSESPSDLYALATRSRRTPSPISWLLDNLAESPVDKAFMNVDPAMSDENVERISWLFENNAFNLPDENRPLSHRNGNTYPSVYGRMKWDQPAPTLTTGFMSPGRGRYIHPLERRTLRSREAARIQGFPNWFNFCPDAIQKQNRGMLAKWIGDAVPTILGFLPSLAVLDGYPFS